MYRIGIFVGVVETEAEIKVSKSDTPYCSFTIIEGISNKQTHSIICFGQVMNDVMKIAKKGAVVAISGKLYARLNKNQDEAHLSLIANKITSFSDLVDHEMEDINDLDNESKEEVFYLKIIDDEGIPW